MKRIRDFEGAFRSTADIQAAQADRLRAHVRYCMRRSPYYGDMLRGTRLPFEAPLTELLDALPLTGKPELEAANDAFLAVPPGKVADIVMSSGTTGRPTRIAYTEHDLKRLAYNEEKAFAGCGLTAADILLLTCTLDRCFIAGLAYFLGARNLGAAAIRNGHDTLEGHVEILRRVAPTAMVGVPSFIRKLGWALRERGLDPAAGSVRRIVAIGEPVRGRDMRLLNSAREIETLWGAQLFSTYASSEIVTSFCECTARNGGHLHADLAIVEILDGQGQPRPDGEVGEVVVTPLGVEGMPLLRFRTGDLSFLMREPCSCGRNTPRLGPILGRRDQMLKVQGTTLYPPAIFAVLSELDGVGDYYVSVGSAAALSDRVTVHVALKPGASLSPDAIASRLRARLRVRPDVRIEPEAVLRKIVYTPASRKPVRFVDHRRGS